MRIARLLAASLLVAGCVAACSNSTGGQAHPTTLTPITPSRSGGPTSATTTTSSAAAPPTGVPIAEAIKWIEAGSPVDAAGYHVALRGGVSTDLGEDVAFTTPAGTTCMTDAKHNAAGLACLVGLTNPPPQPPDIYGQWKGGWVDFDGATVLVGSAHGDPGRFTSGQGPELPLDKSLSFGDFRCRTDAAALYCVDYAHQSAVRMADSGVDTYACAQQVTPPAGVGVKYVC